MHSGMSAALAALGEQQNHLLAHILSPKIESPSRGLAAYRANALVNAQRALEVAYPVIAQMIGEENFAFLARDFLHRHPPVRGDLAQWGTQLAAFVAQVPQLADMPFLADIARVEWALHACASAADRVQDTASFAVLAEDDASVLHFKLAAAALTLASAYPVVSIILAHQGKGTLDAAFALLQQGVVETALVWREGFAPRLRVLHADEQSLVSALLSGQHLGAALDGAHPNFDFSIWLAANVQNGLVLGVLAIDTA